MKKVFCFLTVSLLLSFVSCSSDDFYEDATAFNAKTVASFNLLAEPQTGGTAILDLSSDLLDGGISTTGGKYWKYTYTPGANIVSGIFKFSHSSMYDQFSYWDGFTISNVNDITNYGGGHGAGGSNGWVAHQWSCMPGSGVGTASTVSAGTPGTSGDPFIVAYWSSYKDPKDPEGEVFSEDTYSNWIKIGNVGQYIVTGLKIANHPWPYYGNKFGDGFAQPLNGAGDFFNLYIYGVDANNVVTQERVEVSLAKNTLGGANNLVQSADWITVKAKDFIKLGSVKYLLFQMASSDGDEQWGMNTAAYFCLDKLEVERDV